MKGPQGIRADNTEVLLDDNNENPSKRIHSNFKQFLGQYCNSEAKNLMRPYDNLSVEDESIGDENEALCNKVDSLSPRRHSPLKINNLFDKKELPVFKDKKTLEKEIQDMKKEFIKCQT